MTALPQKADALAGNCLVRDVPNPEMAAPISTYQLVGGHEQTGHWGNV